MAYTDLFVLPFSDPHSLIVVVLAFFPHMPTNSRKRLTRLTCTNGFISIFLVVALFVFVFVFCFSFYSIHFFLSYPFFAFHFLFPSFFF